MKQLKFRYGINDAVSTTPRQRAATIPPVNRAREQADWKEEKNELAKRFLTEALSNALVEARNAKRNGTTNGNQLQSNHGPSDPTGRHEPLDLTSAERLRTQEFEWTTVKRGTKMEAAQRPPPDKIQAYNVEQR